jgi:MFS family permease
MISLAGTWMQSTAQGYLIYQLTNSPAYLGLVGFVGGLPSWLFMLFGGVVADRLPRRTLLVITQVSMMILALVLAALTFTGTVQPWHIILLAFLLGVANAFDAPARVSFITELVSREDMTNGIALNSTMFNIATIAGPAIAGLTYASVGPGWCFALNGLSFIAIIIGLLLMHVKPFQAAPRQKNIWSELAVGLRFVGANKLVMSLTGAVGMVGIFGMGMMTLLPAWARDVLHGDVTTNGWLVSARGIGALISALMLASLGKLKVRGKLWTAGSFLLPILLFAFAWVRWLPLSLFMLAIIGWSYMVIINSSNAMVQSQVPDELRGRVMSVYTLVFFGSMPIGSLLAGAVAEKLTEPGMVMIGAGVLLIFAVAVWMFLPRIRQQE